LEIIPYLLVPVTLFRTAERLFEDLKPKKK
jgi:hypothetical protein